MTNYDDLNLKLDSLAVFSGVRKDPVIRALCELLDVHTVAAYGEFLKVLYPTGTNLSRYVQKAVLNDDNFYVKAVAAGEKIDPEIIDAVKNELSILESVSQISSQDVKDMLSQNLSGCPHVSDPDIIIANLTGWRTEPLHLLREFTAKLANISKTGYGIFAKHTFFRVENGSIVPVAYPDYIPLNQLFEYERERNLIIKNTEALLSGESANNMLLYGDMGTGKSSTIKSVAAAYGNSGLRIIEINKDQLYQVPEIMQKLALNPLKFILFIDDLSFARNDDNFAALKAALEGSVSGRGSNTVIYATSNRRHLLRESAADRYGGIAMDEDMHINDTLQETMSLSARFGLTITFSKPGKDEYLSIVRSLSEEAGFRIVKSSEEASLSNPLTITEELLYQKAEAFAIRKNGRSPRTANQFVELFKIGLQ